ncbi:hypothetical protein [Azoarcus sp. KH32C]|uniref:hypothetical protein n=1 Tax=Azoarcus sp. KH32C TaxID=748247 RepID=UPI00023867D0|nr:hypothetical protein [Azoarcus sp. KH32C]BAL22618.1 hypothetical protein AZKH_0272 [Azoarcus sp. KH32C]
MKSTVIEVAICALAPLAVANAFAGDSGGLSSALAAAAASLGPSQTGQPNQSCEDTPNQPGHSISAPGSAFNPDGKAGTVYAGEQPQNSNNPKSVSQYDVACTRPTH